MAACRQVGHRPEENHGDDFGLTGHIKGSDELRSETVVVDMGVRELKGIARPEHVYQVRAPNGTCCNGSMPSTCTRFARCPFSL